MERDLFLKNARSARDGNRFVFPKKKKGPGVEVIRQLLHKNHQTQTELVVHM